MTDGFVYYIQANNPVLLIGCMRPSVSVYTTFTLSGSAPCQLRMNDNNVYVLDGNTLYRFREGSYTMIPLCTFAAGGTTKIKLDDVSRDFVFVTLEGNVPFGQMTYDSVSVAMNLNDGTLYLLGIE